MAGSIKYGSVLITYIHIYIYNIIYYIYIYMYSSQNLPKLVLVFWDALICWGCQNNVSKDWGQHLVSLYQPKDYSLG